MPDDERFTALIGGGYEDVYADEIRDMLTKLSWGQLETLRFQVRKHERLSVLVGDEMRLRDTGTEREIDRLLHHGSELADQLLSIYQLDEMARHRAPLDP